MTEPNYLEHYAPLIGALLTHVCNVAQQKTPGYGDPPIRVQTNGQTPQGGVLPNSFILLNRDAPNDALWTVVIGFDNWQDVDDHINMEVPEPQFPPLEVPIKVEWYGTNRRGARETVALDFPSIQLLKDRARWADRDWPVDSSDLADAVVKTIIDRVLLHPTPAAALAVSETGVGRWERLKRIASHGQGTVFLAKDRSNPKGELVALKEMRWEKPPTSTAYKRFVREIQITTELGKVHPGIIGVVDYHIPDGGQAGEPFYAMLLADSTLARAKHLKSNLEGVLKIGHALADALVAAHAKGVVHRDVKPSNVLLFGDDQRPVLADFGICFLRTDEEGRLTKTDATTVGPEDYAAPELSGARPDDVDGRADIYSLGKVLYFVLSGGSLFPRERYSDPRFDLRRIEADPRLDHFYGLLERMVVEDPDGRFSDMAQCRDAMLRALDNIRRGVRYEPGMYGGTYSPHERYGRVVRTSAITDQVTRDDVVRDEIRGAVERLDSIAGDPDREPNAAEAEKASLRAAVSGAEHLLAPVLPLIGSNSLEDVERWADNVLALVQERSTTRSARAQNTLAASACLALYAALASAWHRERFVIVRLLMTRYQAAPGRFNHLQLFGRSVKISWAWIVENVGRSEVLRHHDPKLADRIQDVLTSVAGIGVLLYVVQLRPEELDAVAPVGGPLTFPAFPGLLPGFTMWPALLARQFTRDTVSERRVSADVFSASPSDLRQSCQRVTPAIARAMGAVGRELNRMTEWPFDADPEGDWRRWCGAPDK